MIVSARAGRLGSTFVWWVIIAGVLVAAVLATMSLQIDGDFRETAALRAKITRSYETRAELRQILALHHELESGQRGFILTGDPRFLGPYQRARDSIGAAFARLNGDDLADRSLVPELDRAREASLLKRRFAERTIALSQAGQFARARGAVAAGEGRVLMDRIRSSIDAIDRREHARLEQQTGYAQSARSSLQQRIYALQGLLFALLIVALTFLLRTYRRWQRTLAREQESNARHEAIFNAARDGMIVINASGSIESLNPAAAAMFAYEQQDLMRRDVGTLFEAAPDRGRVETFLKRLAAGKAGSPVSVQQFTGRCRNGSFIPLEVSVSPVRLGGKTLFLAVLRDVTERRQIDRMKTEFVSTVSHELRTPLTSISGSLGLIAGGAAGVLPERARRLVEIAQSNCARLIRLINDILDIEKIESGRVTFRIRHLPLEPLLIEAIEAIRPFAATHRVTIELDPVPHGAAILGDEDRVMQILTNLFSNAAKFSPQDEVVRVSVARRERHLRISVADRGPGVPDEFRSRIFGKFAQADSSDTRQKGGTGLGLSIVAHLAERLGGSVSYDSIPGEGATFHVELPAVGTTPSDEAPPLLGRISHGAQALVLHVDDDPDMLRIVASALEPQAQVHSSPSMVEARAALQRYDFDAVILDIAMIDGDGLQLVPLIRRRRGVPIIVFTAQDTEPEQAGQVDLVLVKSRDSLDRLVIEVIRRIDAARQDQQGRQR